MGKVHHLSRQDARRVAVRAQLLLQERPADLLTVVRRLTLLQLDPISAVAPSADLVAWSRLGSAYSPSDLRAALDDRRLIELRALIRPAGDIALYRAAMDVWPGSGELGEAGEPAVVEGVRGEWRVDPAYLDQPFAGRAALLSPFDRLVH